MDITLRIRTTVIVLLISLLLPGLFAGCDVNAGKRPFNYPSSVWVCDSPNMRLIVNANQDITFEIDEPHTEIPEDTQVDFDFGNRMLFYCDRLESKVFVCDCYFFSSQMICTVTSDTLFSGAYLGKRIVFYREGAKRMFLPSEVLIPAVVMIAAAAGWILIRKRRKKTNQGTVQNH